MTEEGLVSTYPFYYPYIHPTMIFEALTRVKQTLIILIVNNPELFISTKKILTTKDSFEYKAIQNRKDNEKDFDQITSYIKKDNRVEEKFNSIRDYILDISDNTKLDYRVVVRKLSSIIKKKIN